MNLSKYNDEMMSVRSDDPLQALDYIR